MTNLAPIALFVYNRPEHTLQTLTELSKCKLIKESTLFIFSDGQKPEATEKDTNRIREVRKIIRQQKWAGTVHLREQETNKGLAKSVVDGVTELCEKFGRVMVLEDDLLVSKSFLTYMNAALEKYKNEEKVYQISGYMFPVKHTIEKDAFFLPLITTWGWATWKRAWDCFDWNPAGALEKLKDKKIRKRFNLDGSYPYSEMLEARLNNKNQSWGILFWWAVFSRDGIVLHPRESLTCNIGFDNSGEHCSSSQNQFFKTENSIGLKDFILPNEIKVENNEFNEIKRYLKISSKTNFLVKIGNKLNNVFG
jgi:hypothetical protein